MEKKRSYRLSPEYVLSGFLYKGPSHGYELHQRLVDEFGYIWHVSQSQTYNILKRLQNQGIIKATSVEQEKLPPRQLLHLSVEGAERFKTWLDTPTSCSVHAIRVEFITRLYFMNLYFPHKAEETIRTQIEEVAAGMERLRAVQRSMPKEQDFNRLAVELRIKLLHSINTWLEECLEVFSISEGHAHEHA